MKAPHDTTKMARPLHHPQENDSQDPRSEGSTMLDKLDFMVRFWQLRARHDAIGAPLATFARVEFLSLIRLMADDLRLPDPGPAPKIEGGLPVQMTAPGGFLAAELR